MRKNPVVEYSFCKAAAYRPEKKNFAMPVILRILLKDLKEKFFRWQFAGNNYTFKAMPVRDHSFSTCANFPKN